MKFVTQISPLLNLTEKVTLNKYLKEIRKISFAFQFSKIFFYIVHGLELNPFPFFIPRFFSLNQNSYEILPLSFIFCVLGNA